MTLATSKNLTILGIATIIGALAVAVGQYAGGGFAAVSWETLIGGIILGVGQVLAKGAASTGGTVNAAGVPVTDPAPPVPSP